MSSAGRELRFQWPVNSSGCTREQIKTQLIFAILPTECVFHYRLNPKKRSSDSDNNLRCIDFYDQFAKLMTLGKNPVYAAGASSVSTWNQVFIRVFRFLSSKKPVKIGTPSSMPMRLTR